MIGNDRKRRRRAAVKSWNTILVATDFAEPAERAFRSARNLLGEGGRLVLVHVVEPVPRTTLLALVDVGDEELEATLKHEAEERMRDRGAGLATRDLPTETLVRVGRPWEEIVDAARERDADAIVMGRSGHSRLDRLLLGSTVENVLRRSPVPVLVVHDRDLSEIRSVLLPVDVDEGSDAAVRYALEELPESVGLTALHVVRPLPPAEPVTGPLVPDLAGIREDLRSRLDGLGGERLEEEVLLRSDVAATILEQARTRDVDLVVLATRGRRGLSRLLLGSVTEKIVRHADRPVLVLPGPDHAEGPDKSAGEGA